MNIVMLNTATLDDKVVIKGGHTSGGGSAGGGNTGGGNTGSDMPVIGDGKTYLYITIAAEGRMDVPLYFTQTVANGVTIDWGDGSPTETMSGTGNKTAKHKYAAIGKYVISLNPVDGCTLGLGLGMSSFSVMGSTEQSNSVYCTMLQAVEIGKGITSIDDYAFYRCHSLASIMIPEGVTNIGYYAFGECYSLASIVIPESLTYIGGRAFFYCYTLSSIVIPNSVTAIGEYLFGECYSLASIVIPEGVTNIGKYAFYRCYSLASIVIPYGVTSIGNNAFQSCTGMAFSDFSNYTSVPSLGSNVFSSIPSDCKIIVPDALYDTWIAATNWSIYASNIIKKSDWDASQS